MFKYNKVLVVLLMLAGILGCSSANDKNIILDATGKHPAGWAVARTGGLHPAVFRANQSACVECHGSATDPITSGGISGVSCFSASRSGIVCHPDGSSGHPVDWNAPGSHGAAAKAVLGYSYCTACHGNNFKGGVGVSCLTCHSSAPHPAAPWRGTTASGTTHTSTNESNAPECARCHLNGQRLATPEPVPVGTTPGCFNNTLCHGVSHPAGWNLPVSHGAAAKALPDVSHGFSYCIQCHNTNYVDGPAKSCKACHISAPHPGTPWRSTSGSTHTTTNQGNAPECSRCHAAGAKLATPGNILVGATCFNNMLCHGTKTSHSFPYPGYLHKGSTSGCSSCHVLGTGTSSYPAATANRPPDCKSCHRLSTAASMAQMAGCSDCHGDIATGMPNGTVFPNIDKRHSSPSEHKVACSICHAGGGTGTVSHGNSNNSVKTAANVILNGTASGMNIVRNPTTGKVTCNGSCHGESHSGRTW